jgi:3-(3-hydroxy-phenyl)propionate hydroxylase
MESSIPQVDVDVAVIGCGTTGLTLASLLSAGGVRVAAVDRHRLQVAHPRATHLDDETMRSFQAIGLQELERTFSKVGKYSIYDEKWRTCMEVENDRGVTEQGWRSDYMFHQPDFEAIVRGRLHEASDVEIFFGWEVTELTDTGDRVEVRLREVSSGQERLVNAAFAVGSDGANSFVRRTLDPEITNFEATHRSLIVDIFPFVDQPKDLPERDSFIRGGVRNPFTYVPIAAPRLRFELMLRPEDDTEELERVDVVYEMLSPWYKADEYRILRDDVYEWHSLVPSPWRVGRMMIAGDAAHTMPPMLGQGMCTGIRDALNLAWKLPRVIRGESPIELLDTYESERRPHAEVFVAISGRIANDIESMEPEAPPEGVDAPVKEGGVLRPQIGPGVRAEDEPAGLLGAQPRLTDGRLLDDAVGFRFAAVGDAGCLDAVGAATRATWEKLDVAVQGDDGEEMTEWLRSLDAAVVLMRPDRYIFGVADGPAELEHLTELLESQLTAAAAPAGSSPV